MTAANGTVAYSHLFPGVEIAVEAGPAPLSRLALRFSDGSAAEAEIIADDRGACLEVSAYRTAAGTEMAARIWQIAAPPLAELDRAATIRLGRKLPGPS